jgi:hypothetical protein
VTVDQGWYSDPWKQAPSRLWNGSSWTDQIAGGRGVQISPVPQRRAKRRVAACTRCRKFVVLSDLSWWAVGAALLTLVMVLIAMSLTHVRAPGLAFLLSLAAAWLVANRDPGRWKCPICHALLDRHVAYGTVPPGHPA